MPKSYIFVSKSYILVSKVISDLPSEVHGTDAAMQAKRLNKVGRRVKAKLKGYLLAAKSGIGKVVLRLLHL